MSQDGIHHGPGGTSFVGRQAVDLFRAITLHAALGLHVRTNGQIRAHRMLTPARLLQLATDYTGKPYKRGQHAQALADLEFYISAARESQADAQAVQS